MSLNKQANEFEAKCTTLQWVNQYFKAYCQGIGCKDLETQIGNLDYYATKKWSSFGEGVNSSYML